MERNEEVEDDDILTTEKKSLWGTGKYIIHLSEEKHWEERKTDSRDYTRDTNNM